MQPAELITQLRIDGTLANWVKVIADGDKEYVTGTWYNMAMVLADDIEDQMCEITRNMWEFGLQAFDWDYFYELMIQKTA